MFKVLVSVAVLAMGFASQQSLAEDFVEPGRVGFLMAMTQDGAQFGGAYYADKFEVNLTFDGSAWDTKSSSVNTTDQDLGVTARVGMRHNMGSYNYLSFGVHYHENFFGTDGDTQGKAKERRYGPYIGFQRAFPNTGVYILAFVLPVSYQTNDITSIPDGSEDMHRHTYKFFQEGGFGIAYLF